VLWIRRKAKKKSLIGSIGLNLAASQSAQARSRLLLPEALQVLRHLARKREVLGVEALYLLNARSGILGEIEDVDLAV
jgi:hypothetical protein